MVHGSMATQFRRDVTSGEFKYNNRRHEAGWPRSLVGMEDGEGKALPSATSVIPIKESGTGVNTRLVIIDKK